uniref:Ribosomal protein S20 n=1 Tax=Ptilothamnion sphaericum TaxID=1498216 RepID=A0A4D6WX92_9FLOR|nr:ribosomal protein S20 [Ptilothamnion sphaericum]
MKKNLSAIKRTQLSLRNRAENKKYKVAIKSSIKKYLLYFDNNQDPNMLISLEYLSLVYQRIDKAVKKGVIHKNKAARKKSRLAKMIKPS